MSNCPSHTSAGTLAPWRFQWGLRWRLWLAALLLVPASAGAAVARDLCAGIAPLIALAEGPSDKLVDVPQTPGPGAASCRLEARPTGGFSYCSWTFPYRSDEAAATFEQFADQLEGCFGPEAAPGGGPGVNHPDSYTQRRYTAGPVSISLSLKDKAALDSTFVFVIVTGSE